jgi:hypothetical protein
MPNMPMIEDAEPTGQGVIDIKSNPNVAPKDDIALNAALETLLVKKAMNGDKNAIIQLQRIYENKFNQYMQRTNKGLRSQDPDPVTSRRKFMMTIPPQIQKLLMQDVGKSVVEGKIRGMNKGMQGMKDILGGRREPPPQMDNPTDEQLFR